MRFRVLEHSADGVLTAVGRPARTVVGDPPAAETRPTGRGLGTPSRPTCFPPPSGTPGESTTLRHPRTTRDAAPPDVGTTVQSAPLQPEESAGTRRARAAVRKEQAR